MGRKIEVPIGTIFGSWTVIGSPISVKKHLLLPCRCKCGKESLINKSAISHGRSKGCLKCINGDRNRLLTRDLSPTWKGGRHIDEHGYVMIYLPEHPRSKKNGYIREHTVLMEQSINRHLEKHESVHHINGVRDDNRLENLELWSKSQPYGQRISDKVKWAKEILERYEPENV